MLRVELKPWLGLAATEFSKADLRTARDRMVERGTLIAANASRERNQEFAQNRNRDR